jgi:thymidylate kinase
VVTKPARLGEAYFAGMSLAEFVDSLLRERAIVFGAPPPQGRDLDLLVRPATESRLAAELGRVGFSQHGGEWVRFRGCGVEALDLVPTETLGLPQPELEALFTEARPLDGLAHLARPAPHHMLLLLARSYDSKPDFDLTPKRRRRITRALEEEPSAFERGRQTATAWDGIAAVDRLEAAYQNAKQQPPPPGDEPPRRPWDRVRDLRWRLGTLRWGPVIAFSGLDGSGKTTQIEALRDSLDRLGFDVAIEWTRLEWTTLWEGASILDRIGTPVKKVLRLLTRAPVDAPRQLEYGERPADTASALRERNPLLTGCWVLIVALLHAAAQRRAVQAQLRRGKVVICDRYTLDSAVHLRHRYGAQHRFRPQVRLMHLFSPRPIRSYLVDVPATVALSRKAEQFGLEELERQADLYRQESVTLGVRRLDGTHECEQLCAEIGYDVWSALRPVL